MHRPGSMYMCTSHGLVHTKQEDICSPIAARSLQVAESHSPYLAACCPFWGTCKPTSQTADLSAVALSPASGALAPTQGCASGPPPAICRQREVPLHRQGDQCITCCPAADHEEHPSSRLSWGFHGRQGDYTTSRQAYAGDIPCLCTDVDMLTSADANSMSCNDV